MKTMNFKSIIIAAIALTGFAGNAVADTTKLLEADGWTKITTVPTSSDIANNYYVFVDATQDLMLGIGKGEQNTKAWYSLGLYYRNSVEPTSKDITQFVWTLESNGGGFSMRNLDQPVHLFQTEYNAAWYFDTNDVTSSNGWSKVNLALSDGKFTLENGQYTGNYIGPWNDNNFTNGAECAANKTTALRGYFYIYAISRAQFKQNLLDNASSSNPVDLTPWYVSNATFDGGNRTGWTEDGSGGNNNTHGRGGGGEIWHRSNFKIYQDLTLPNGKYKVSLQIAGTTGAGQVYGTSGSTTKTVASSAVAGDNFQNTISSMIQDRTYGKVTTDEIEVSNGALQMGMQCSTSDQWLVFDNFKLYCTGVDLSAYETQLSDLVSECNTFISSGAVTDACENAISSAVDAYNQSYATAKEYSNAIIALTAVLDTYRNDADLQAAYASYKTMRTEVQALENTSTYHYTDPGTAKSTFDSAITSANTAVEAATTASAINTQTGNLRAAALTFISSVTAEDGNPFNLTFLASTAAADWQTASGLNAAATAPAWSVPKPDASMADFIESYTEAEGGESITGNILYQTLSSMPAGYYTVALYAAASYTPNRGSLVEKCTDGQPNITFGFAGESTLSLPVVHRTQLTAADQVPVNLSVQLASSGNLTFGIKKTAAGSNWHVAQIYTITYSKDPDLTILKADRDALVSEAEGVLASADASLLTTAQRSSLSSAISTANSANTFDDLTTVTLTTLPNAIQTARQQIQTVKENRVLMIAALERFENDYNLADGTDYRRNTMSAKAWTDLLTAVNNVTIALDDVSQASSYGTLKDALVSQMNATDASLRLFKSYKAMVEGTTALSIVGSYGADSNMDTDATQETAIAALNTAFGTYANAQNADFGVSAFLGENLDFNAAAGSVINGENSNTIKNVAGWEVEYADADTWAVLQTDQASNDGKLYIRKNWGESATTLTVLKHKMLPVGKYRLSLSWNSDMENMTNRSQFKLGEEATAIGAVSDGIEPLEYIFEVTGAATPFDLTIGFQKTGKENTPAQIIVDNVTLTALGANSRLLGDYNPVALWFDATDSKYAAATGVTVTPTAPNQIIKAAAAGQFTAPTKNVVVGGTCANLVITDGYPLEIQEGFTATSATYSRSMSNAWGTIILPFALSSDENVQFYSLKASDAENMTFAQVESVTANTPVAFKKLSGDGITITGNNVSVVTTASAQGSNITASGWTAEGSYTAQSIADFDGIYYIANNTFYAADGAMTVNPFRAIFRNPVGVKSFGIFVDDATGIRNISVQEANEDVYDLSGRRVNTPRKNGVYIMGGKKVVIK